MINIKSSSYTLYEELKRSAPEGVQIELQPIKIGFRDHAPSPDEMAVVLNINVNVAIDLTKIAALAAGTWIAKKYISVRSRENELKVMINEKPIPLGEEKSRKLIEAEIFNSLKNKTDSR